RLNGHRPGSYGSAAAFLGPVGHLDGQGTDDTRHDRVDVEADVCEDLLPRALRQELVGHAEFDDADPGVGLAQARTDLPADAAAPGAGCGNPRTGLRGRPADPRPALARGHGTVSVGPAGGPSGPGPAPAGDAAWVRDRRSGKSSGPGAGADCGRPAGAEAPIG